MWDEDDEKYGRKVEYWTAGERSVRRTAYLDTWLGGDDYSGTEKHTDVPIIVRWTGSAYIEVEQPPCICVGPSNNPRCQRHGEPRL